MDADRHGPRAADDPRPLLLLRRHGPVEKRRLDDAAELRRDGRDQPALDRGRLQPRVRHQRARPDWRPADLLHVHARRRLDASGSRSDDSARRVRAVPAEVRDHHAGADHRIVCRARPVLQLPAVHVPVQHLHLLAAGALDVAPGRLPAQAGRARLRGRNRGAHVGGLCRVGGGHRARPARCASGRRVAHAGQHPLRDPRHGPAVVRVVWLQRRIGALGIGSGGHGVRDDEHGVGVGGAGLDLLRPDARPEAVSPRRVRRGGGRAGRDHACGRLRHDRGEHLHRHLRERRVEPDGALEERIRARRHAGRLPVPRRRRHGRDADDRPLRQRRRPDLGPRDHISDA